MSLIKLKGLVESDGEVFPTVPTGKYPCTIVSTELKETGPGSKFPGSPMLFVRARITEGEYKGESLVFNITLPSDAADDEYNTRSVARVKRLLLAAGVTTTTDELEEEDLMGLQLGLEVEELTRDGKKQNNVKDQYKL